MDLAEECLRTGEMSPIGTKVVMPERLTTIGWTRTFFAPPSTPLSIHAPLTPVANMKMNLVEEIQSQLQLNN